MPTVEHGCAVTYSMVLHYVARRRQVIQEAEVNFADLWIDLAGVWTKVVLFTLLL